MLIANYKQFLQIILCLLLASVLALTSHIYVLEWVKPALDSMRGEILSEPLPYSSFIISMAYTTACLTVGVKVFVYYHAQHLLPDWVDPIKTLLVACIHLELNGNLIRQPVMDFLVNQTTGLKSPFLFAVINSVDKWVSALF
jgi:hypothetical protein